jgi:hypothetical protein
LRDKAFRIWIACNVLGTGDDAVEVSLAENDMPVPTRRGAAS